MIKKVFIVIGIFLTGACCWLGSQAVALPEHASIRGYGGHLSMKTQSALQTLNLEIQHADEVLLARSDRIWLRSAGQPVRKYMFAYGSLWRDGEPLLTGVHNFMLEYRDARGSLVSRVARNTSVRSVGYTARIAEGSTSVLCRHRVRINTRPVSTPNDRILIAYFGID